MEEFINNYLPTMILSLISGAIGCYFAKYFSEKGKNLATKEDIELITKKIENVKAEFAKQHLKSQAYLERQLTALDAIVDALYNTRVHYLYESNNIYTAISQKKFLDSEKFNKDQEMFDNLAKSIEKNGLYISKNIYERIADIFECIVQLKSIKAQIRANPSQVIFNMVPSELYNAIFLLTQKAEDEMKKELFTE